MKYKIFISYSSLDKEITGNIKRAFEEYRDIQEKEKTATQWWEKRDLTNEYLKIKEYNKAWTLFNEAVLLRVKDDMPCETIYSHMASMLIKEKKYKNALLQYAFYFSEWLSFSKKTDFPKYVIDGIVL